MSKVHVLESNNNGSYNIVIHFDIAGGTNSVGVSWKEASLNSGATGTSVMTVGTGAGQISQAEYDSIVAGDIIEIVDIINPGVNPTTADVEQLANILITTYQQNMAAILKYYGFTVEV